MQRTSPSSGRSFLHLGAWVFAALVVVVGCSPSTSPDISGSPSPSASSAPASSPSETPVPEPDLVVRLTSGLHNPPALTLTVEIMSDGQVVLGGGSKAWTARSLTAAGLDQIALAVLSAPLLQASADYPTQVIQPSGPAQGLPVGLTAATWTFTVGGGSDPVVVTSRAWLGDETEAMYFVPSPERKELDRLANLLASVSDWVTADGWASATWVSYEAASYLFWVTVWAETPGDGLPSVDGATWPFGGPIEAFGEVVATGVGTGRCGYLDPAQATDIAGTLSEAGVDPLDPNPGVVTDGFWVSLYLSPRTMDGFPTCADEASYLPPYGS